MKWGDNPRDSDNILAVWPSYRPYYNCWFMEELAEHGDMPPKWRDRRIPTTSGNVRLEVHESEGAAKNAASLANEQYSVALNQRNIPEVIKKSLELKVLKSLQSKERLEKEELLMRAEARRRNNSLPRPMKDDISMSKATEGFRDELYSQLLEMPYLKVALVGLGGRRRVLVKDAPNGWSMIYVPNKLGALQAWRGQTANGFGLSAIAHWGKTKASIRQILLPRANQLLQLASVQRMLAEALAEGRHVLVAGPFIFWYEQDGQIGWQVKQTASTKDSEGATLWSEGTIHSVNHGRLVVLPYMKENGQSVRGHTKNGPNDGPAKPRHPDHYVDIPFEMLEDDLMIGLFGELPYE